MRTPTARRSHGIKFNIISMIDIFFLLIIFFITAARFVHSESQYELQLPTARGNDPGEQAERLLVVTITPDRKMHIGPTEVDLEEVEAQILSGREKDAAKFEVRIRSDRNVPYRDIEPILLACARSGVTNVKFPVME
ncbi:MAG: ExbD/TolR family protein [Planctomycetaceae bacterium]